MGVNCSQSVPVYVTQRCGSSWVVVDRCGIVVGRCGSLWDRSGSLWIVVDRCGSLWVVLGFSNYVYRPPKPYMEVRYSVNDSHMTV